MQEKFILAVEKFLAEKKAKNVYQLSLAAGIDQAAFSSFLKTHQYLDGKGEKPSRIKNDLYLDSAGKVIEYMGGELVFPWDKESDENYMEIIRLRKELEASRERITILEKELYACEKTRDRYEDMIRGNMAARHDMPVEIRQNKSSA